MLSACVQEAQPDLTVGQPVATTTPVALPADPALRTGLIQYLGGRAGGVSAVLERDGVVEAVTIGVANSDEDPITVDTAFYVGSISKVFTATLVMRLADEGRIDLDQPLSAYLPDIKVGANATIRSLLSHRSGLPNYTDHESFVPDVLADRTRSWTPAEILLYVDASSDASSGGVNEPFSYSNTNYLLLGMLIEQTHGTDLDTVLQTEISGPLGLDHTVFAGHGVATPPALAAPYIGDPAEPGIAGTIFESIVADSGIAGMQYESTVSSGFAAGALVSTPTDLSMFLGALLGGELVSPESLDEMIAPQRGDYGLGIETLDIGGATTWLGHGGSIIGYHSIMAVDPETGDVLVIVTNNETLDPAGFARRFLGS